MPLSITPGRGQGRLRVADAGGDALVALLIDAAEARVAACHGSGPGCPASPAPLRLAVLLLVAHAYEHRDGLNRRPAWSRLRLAPYREARL